MAETPCAAKMLLWLDEIESQIQVAPFVRRPRLQESALQAAREAAREAAEADGKPGPAERRRLQEAELEAARNEVKGRAALLHSIVEEIEEEASLQQAQLSNHMGGIHRSMCAPGVPVLLAEVELEGPCSGISGHGWHAWYARNGRAVCPVLKCSVGIRGNRGSWESVRAEFGETQGLRWSLRWLSLWSMMPSLASHVRMSCPEISQHIRTELWEVFQASQSQLANQQGQLYRPYAEHI
ncbi:unnamed protein product [Symbiodinium natans]|uniref:Uncharacterized protein n=1 Tax=Symbiodinium natans TaxID=878477 RepID=A0A812PJ53_9DINO|nr:unnamed protein product [Symbiodinium natans]